MKLLPIPPKVLAYAIGPSYREFLHTTGLAPRLRSRQQEIRLRLADQDFFVNYPDQLNSIVLVSEETPELFVILPILASIADACTRMTLQVVRDSEDLTSLVQLLDDIELGELDLPQWFFFDEEWELQGQWGPQPQEAEQALDEWLERHPHYEALAAQEAPTTHEQVVHEQVAHEQVAHEQVAHEQVAHEALLALVEELSHEMRVWYNSGLNQACITEIRTLLASWLEEPADEDEANGNGNDA